MRFAGAIAMLLLSMPAALAAQAQQGSPPERIDLLVREPERAEDAEFEDCSAEQDAASISGEIIVCRRKPDTGTFDKEDWESRYADRTRDKDDPRAPDVEGRNVIPMVGVSVVFKGCFIPPCPPPLAYMIDFSSLPETPPGSDADRVGRGLAPRGQDDASEPTRLTPREEALGLPPVPGEAESVSPSGSASPVEEPSG